MYYSKKGTGPVVILLHGFPESGSLWRNIEPGLSQDFTLIIPDLPGSGRSELRAEMNIPQMADAVKTLMDKEGINKAVLAGHSMGGYAALAFADKYPEKVSGLSLVHSTPLADDDEKKIMRQKTIDLIKKGGKNIFVREMVPNLFSEDFKQSKPEVVKEQIEEALKMPEDGMINFYYAMMLRKETTDVLDKAIFPVQWILGINDNIISYKKILKECCRSGINFVSVYDHCGHMSMFEAAGKLESDIRQFVNYCNTYPNG